MDRFGHTDIWRRPAPGLQEHKEIQNIRNEIELEKKGMRDKDAILCGFWQKGLQQKEQKTDVRLESPKRQADVVPVTCPAKKVKAGDHCFFPAQDTVVTVLFADNRSASVVDEANGMIFYADVNDLTGPLE